MTLNLSRLTRKTTRVRNLFVAILVLGWTFGRITHVEAQKITPPTTPGALTPPAGNSAFLLGHAVGTQGYVCLPTSAGASTASWTVDAARPEATLLLVSSGDMWRWSHTPLAPIPTPTRSPQIRYRSAAQPGRVPSTAARFGDNRCNRFLLAPTRAARMLGRLPASYCSQSGQTQAQPAVTS